VTPARAGRREWIALAVLALPTLLVALDTFVMLLALPHLSRDLGASGTEQLWIMDVYGFMVAGFLVTMGTLGDRIGRRRLLLIGAAAFGVTSVLAAYSVNPIMLILARAALGIAGATLTPSTLALIMNLFRDPKQRAAAVGMWVGCFTAGAIIGPLAGGALLDHFWWGSVFLLGVPAMVLLLVAGPILLPEYRDPHAGRLDLTSVALSLAAILPIIYGLKEVARQGWRPAPIAVFVAGVAVGVLFLRRQRRLADPLLDLSLFTRRSFTITLTGMLMYSMLAGGTMVFVAQYFQLVAGLSSLRAGLALLPATVAAIVSYQVCPRLAQRVRPAVLFPAGLAVTIGGLLIVARAHPSSGLLGLIIGFTLASVGGGPLVSLGTNLVVGSAPVEKAGSAAGIAQTGNELGYALGIAVLGSIGAAAYRGQMTGDMPGRESLTAAVEAAQRLPGTVGAELLQHAQGAFTGALHVVALVSAALLAVLAVVIRTGLGHLRPIGESQPTPESPTPEPERQPGRRPAGSSAGVGSGPDRS